MDQIKYEKILISLLGLSIVEKENNEYYEILDEDNNLVGYIKKIRVFNKDKATPIAFNFQTKIKTETVNFTNSRPIDTLDNKTDIFNYNIDIIEKNQTISKVIKVNLDEKPSLLILDQNDDAMKFHVEYDKLYFSYQKQLKDKKYYHYSGYVGGLKEIGYDKLLKEKSDFAVIRAVKGMLPKNSLGAKMIKKLRVYKDANHNHEAQKPVLIEIKGARV